MEGLQVSTKIFVFTDFCLSQFPVNQYKSNTKNINQFKPKTKQYKSTTIKYQIYQIPNNI